MCSWARAHSARFHAHIVRPGKQNVVHLERASAHVRPIAAWSGVGTAGLDCAASRGHGAVPSGRLLSCGADHVARGGADRHQPLHVSQPPHHARVGASQAKMCYQPFMSDCICCGVACVVSSRYPRKSTRKSRWKASCINSACMQRGARHMVMLKAVLPRSGRNASCVQHVCVCCERWGRTLPFAACFRRVVATPPRRSARFCSCNDTFKQ